MGSPRFVSDLDEDEDEQDPVGPRFVSDLPDDEEYEVPPEPQAPQEHQAPDVPWYEDLAGGAASAADGVLHNYGGEVGRTMAHGMNTVGGWMGAGEVVNPDEAERTIDQATRDYPAAHSAGRFGTDVLAGMAAPGRVLAQGAVGAATNGLGELGSSGDMAKAGLASAFGGAAGMAGATAGKVVDAGGSALAWLAEKGAGYLGKALAGPVGGAAAQGVAKAFTGGLKKAPGAAPTGSSMAQRGGSLAGAISGELTSMFPPEKARGEDKAYATAETYDWAQKVVASSGQSGLSTEDEEQLSAAIASGNQKQLASLSYQLQQRNPRYKRQVERALRAANGETNE